MLVASLLAPPPQVLPSTTYTSIQVVPNTRSRNIQAFATSSNGLKIYLTVTPTSVKISHVSCPLDFDYKPSNVAASNLYTSGGTDEIHFTGNIREGVHVYGVGGCDVVVDSNNNGTGQNGGGGNGGISSGANRNYVYCHDSGNSYAVNPLDGDVCDVVCLPSKDYIETLTKRSKVRENRRLERSAAYPSPL